MTDSELRSVVEYWERLQVTSNFEAGEQLLPLLSLAKSVLGAKWPEKKTPTHDRTGNNCCQYIESVRFNEAIDLCQAFHAKKMMEKDAEIKEFKTVLQAWQDTFGTTQLTHAEDRLDCSERKNFANLKEKEKIKLTLDKIFIDCIESVSGGMHIDGSRALDEAKVWVEKTMNILTNEKGEEK